MDIISQMKLFEESDFENLGDLERLQTVPGVLDDGAGLDCRRLQTYFCARFFKNEEPIVKLNVEE